MAPSQHPKKSTKHSSNRINHSDNDKNDIDDRNERTVMLSRIPKHIHEEMIHKLVQDAIWKKQQEQTDVNNVNEDDDDETEKNHESSIELVTLVYPTDNDVMENKNHGDRNDSLFHKKRNATTTTNNNSHTSTHPRDDSNRFDDRPYKKKLHKVSHNDDNDVRNTIDASASPPEHCGYGFVRFHSVEEASFVLTHLKTLRFDRNNITTSASNNSSSRRNTTPQQEDVSPTERNENDVNESIESSNTNTMKKKPKYHTIYIGPCSSGNNSKDDTHTTSTVCEPPGPNPNQYVCFLWTEFRCPYGTTCKFQHTGEGGCTASNTNKNNNTYHPSNDTTTTTTSGSTTDNPPPHTLDRRKKIKCFNFRKGKCKLDATTCPYSHDFTTTATTTCVPCQENDTTKDDGNNNTTTTSPPIMVGPKKTILKRDDCDKDCLDYMNKNGKCRKLRQNLPCPYRHDATKLLDQQKRHDQKQKKMNRQQRKIQQTVQ